MARRALQRSSAARRFPQLPHARPMHPPAQNSFPTQSRHSGIASARQRLIRNRDDQSGIPSARRAAASPFSKTPVTEYSSV